MAGPTASPMPFSIAHVTPYPWEQENEVNTYIERLTRELSDEKIEFLLNAEASLEEHCAHLIQAANKAGGHDNITCLLVRVD